MSDVVVAADFGSSLGRAIFSANSGYVNPELVMFEPEVVEVPKESIETTKSIAWVSPHRKIRLG